MHLGFSPPKIYSTPANTASDPKRPAIATANSTVATPGESARSRSAITAIAHEDTMPATGVYRERLMARANGAMTTTATNKTNNTGAGFTDGPSHHGGFPTVLPVMADAVTPKMTPDHVTTATTCHGVVSFLVWASGAGVANTCYTVVGSDRIPPLLRPH